MPALEAALGPGVAAALARTAGQLRADADCLDDLAFAESGQLRPAASPGDGPPGDGVDLAGLDVAGLDVAGLAALPAAIRTRVLRDAALRAGCPPGALAARHIGAVDALVTAWRGQRWTDLPGGVRASRRAGKVWFSSAR
jgi:tRNA(Ile)-lysidine synthase